MEFDNNSEGDVRSRDVEPELERVEECRRYPERQRYPPVCFGIDEYADTVVTECLDKNQITEPSTTEHALVGYSDADWTRDHDHCHPTTGNVFLMSGGTIKWFSKEQSSVALSTTETEHMALSVNSQEAVWLRRMRDNPQANPKDPTVILEEITVDLLTKPLSRERFETLGMNVGLVYLQLLNV